MTYGMIISINIKLTALLTLQMRQKIDRLNSNSSSLTVDQSKASIVPLLLLLFSESQVISSIRSTTLRIKFRVTLFETLTSLRNAFKLDKKYRRSQLNASIYFRNKIIDQKL